MSSGSPFNEAGEPIMDGAAWRFEQQLDQEREDMRPYEPEDYLFDGYGDEEDEEEEDDGTLDEKASIEFEDRMDEAKELATDDEDYVRRVKAIEMEFFGEGGPIQSLDKEGPCGCI
jgi:hypothetical protein